MSSRSKPYRIPWETVGYLTSIEEFHRFAEATSYGGNTLGLVELAIGLAGLSFVIFEKIIFPWLRSKKMRNRFHELEEKLGIHRPHPSTSEFLKAVVGDWKDTSVVFGHPREHPVIAKKSKPDRFELAEELKLDEIVANELTGLLDRCNLSVSSRPIGKMGYDEFITSMNKNLVACSGGIGKDGIARAIFQDLPVRADYEDPLHPITVEQRKGKHVKYTPGYANKQYSHDVGVIAVSRHPNIPNRYSLATFGSHAYGTLGAGKAISLSKAVPLDLYTPEPKEYHISEISREPIEEMTKVLVEKKPGYCYYIVKVELQDGKIDRIVPFQDKACGPGPFWIDQP